MGQKVNPNGLRVGVIKNWDSRWFAKDNVFGDLLVEDYKIRKDLKKRLYDAGVPAIEIERKNDEIKIMIQCARPGMVVGRGGEDIKKLEEELTKKYCSSAREAHRFPPCNEAVHGPCNAHGRQGHQGFLRRPSGRRGNRTHRALPRGYHSAADPACGHRLWFC